jgi:hypothetical protein
MCDIRRAIRDVWENFIEGFCIIAILFATSIAGFVLSSYITKELAHRCAVELQRATQ